MRTILRNNGEDEDTIDRGIYGADDLYRVYVFIECLGCAWANNVYIVEFDV